MADSTASNDTRSASPKASSSAVRFLGGTTVGLLLVAIPFFASGMPLQALTAWQMGLGVFSILSGGILGLILGEPLFNGIMRVLEGMGGY